MSGAFTLVFALFTLWFLFGREEIQRFFDA
jgi:hypothetical protein